MGEQGKRDKGKREQQKQANGFRAPEETQHAMFDGIRNALSVLGSFHP